MVRTFVRSYDKSMSLRVCHHPWLIHQSGPFRRPYMFPMLSALDSAMEVLILISRPASFPLPQKLHGRNYKHMLIEIKTHASYCPTGKVVLMESTTDFIYLRNPTEEYLINYLTTFCIWLRSEIHDTQCYTLIN